MGNHLMWTVYLLYLLILVAPIYTSVAPTGFLEESGTHLVLWANYWLEGGTSAVKVESIHGCLAVCKADSTCVSFEMNSQELLLCKVHARDATTKGCSSDASDLHAVDAQVNQTDTQSLGDTSMHYKIQNRCYADFPLSSGKIVTVRDGLTVGSAASSISECNILCQIATNCSVAEYNTLDNSCSLFPRLNSAPAACRSFHTATRYSTVPQPCALVPEYTAVTGGYYGTDFFSATTIYTSHVVITSCRQQCDALPLCLGFAFDFSFELSGGCRLYATNSLCSIDLLISGPGNNWFTYTKKNVCQTGTTPTTTPSTTTPVPTLPTTTAPIVRYVDYDLVLDIQVRGGSLRSTSKSVSVCRLGCDQSASCKAFDYVREGSLCYHLDATTFCLTPTPHRNSLHYRKKTSKCTWEYAAKKVLGGERVYSATTVLTCERACRLKYACRGFDFNSQGLECYLHIQGNICSVKQDAIGVVHYRLRGEICPTESHAIVYENSKLIGGVNHGVAESVLACYAKCTQDPACTGIDFHKVSHTCWFQSVGKRCTAPLADNCCDHLRVPNACTLTPDPTRPRQAFVDILSVEPWKSKFATMVCESHGSIRTICAAIQTISRDRALASLNYIGTMPWRDKVLIRFETVTAGKVQDELLTTRINEALRSQQLQGHTGKVTFHDLPPRLEVSEVTPLVGPRSGGTSIILIGFNLHFTVSVSLGDVTCPINVTTPTMVMCMTLSLSDNTYINVALNVTVHTGGGTATPAKAAFRYKTDPAIFSIYPLSTILSGGVYLTVVGNNLDVVGHPLMTTTEQDLDTIKTQVFTTTCVVDSSVRMRCPTPSFTRGAITRRRRETANKKHSHQQRTVMKHDHSNMVVNRQRRDTVNRLDNKDYTIAFRLDGVAEYTTLTGPLVAYSQITVYEDPVIRAFPGDQQMLTFVSVWPISERVIQIKGARLTDGLQGDDFLVQIGAVRCPKLKVFINRIECEPPTARPYVKFKDRVSGNRIPVKVKIGHLVFDVGYMQYQQTLWEYPPGKWVIIGGVSGLVFIIILICLFCCCCCYARENDRQQSYSESDWIPPSPPRTRDRSSRQSRHQQNHGYRSREGSGHHRDSRQSRHDLQNRNHREAPRGYRDRSSQNFSGYYPSNHRQSNGNRHSRQKNRHYPHSLDILDNDLEDVYKG